VTHADGCLRVNGLDLAAEDTADVAVRLPPDRLCDLPVRSVLDEGQAGELAMVSDLHPNLPE
jgi:hypothetical protein